MRIDKALEMALNQEETTQATHVMTNDIDISKAGDPAKPMWWNVLITEDFATSAGGTMQFKLLTDGDSAFGSAVTLIDFGAIAAATLVAGYKLRQLVPLGMEQYLRGQAIIGTGAMTAGKFTSWLSQEAQTNE